MREVSKEFTSPIRLMFGIGNNLIQGFSIVYEDLYEGKMSLPMALASNGFTAQSINVWFEEELFSKVRFTHAGDSCIVWSLTEVPAKQTFFRTTEAHWVRTVREIRIRSDFQFTEK